MRKTSATQRAEFDEIYRSHLPAIAAYASRRASAPDAVDVVAETFAIAWRRLDELPDEPTIRPWLYGVARRVVANQRRGALRRSSLHARLCDEWIVKPQSDAGTVELAPLRLALQTLSEADREILMLAGVEELKPADIAIVLDVSPEVARNRLSRARRRLRDAMSAPSLDVAKGDRS